MAASTSRRIQTILQNCVQTSTGQLSIAVIFYIALGRKKLYAVDLRKYAI